MIKDWLSSLYSRIPSRQQKEKYALGIITLFPSLKDPFSPKGYVSFTTLLRKHSTRFTEKGFGILVFIIK